MNQFQKKIHFLKSFLRALGINPNSNTLELDFKTKVEELGIENQVDLSVFEEEKEVSTMIKKYQYLESISEVDLNFNNQS